MIFCDHRYTVNVLVYHNNFNETGVNLNYLFFLTKSYCSLTNYMIIIYI
jgi:hypothetical protein